MRMQCRECGKMSDSVATKAAATESIRREMEHHGICAEPFAANVKPYDLPVTDAYERRTVAMERQAAALEELATAFVSLAGGATLLLEEAAQERAREEQARDGRKS